MRSRWTGPYDREIARLALPALGALAAEPLYLLADTAIVGHLGTPQLAALALASTVLDAFAAFCNFLTYGVTAQVARLHGAGQPNRAGEVAVQSLWVALAVGLGVAAIAAGLAPQLIGLLGGHGHVATLAARFLRIGALGLPCALVALAGQGYQRGAGDLRSPLLVVVAANLLNLALELWSVYGLGLGVAGSAWATVIAQAAMGAAFASALWRAGAMAADRRAHWARMRPLLRMGSALVLRTTSLYGAFIVASAVVARVGATSLGAHQIGMQLFGFLALLLDAIAIAGQVLIGRRLGAGDGAGARAVARRIIELSLAGGIVLGALLDALGGVIPRAFTDDPHVLGRAAAMWPLLCLLQVVGAVAYALDGILLGAGETTYLAGSMVVSGAVYAAVSIAALLLHWGLTGVWAGFIVLMLVRDLTCGARFRGERWVVLGASPRASPTSNEAAERSIATSRSPP
ncbi:MAG TPA: MATE family efflux transporter [Solirubrobacteraceae bacterium]|nr:MATE family efflux transporter [Solirubrobacteraceae bacterium]